MMCPVSFYNRADELTALEERWQSPRAEYIVIYGRRRIGKTELILRFAEHKRCLYFEATSGTENDHLEDLIESPRADKRARAVRHPTAQRLAIVLRRRRRGAPAWPAARRPGRVPVHRPRDASDRLADQPLLARAQG